MDMRPKYRPLDMRKVIIDSSIKDLQQDIEITITQVIGEGSRAITSGKLNEAMMELMQKQHRLAKLEVELATLKATPNYFKEYSNFIKPEFEVGYNE